MTITRRNLETIKNIISSSAHLYAAADDGWLAATNNHVIYAFRSEVINGSGWVVSEILNRWLSLMKGKKTIHRVEVNGWSCTYWVSDNLDPIHVKAAPGWKTPYTVQQLLRPFQPETHYAHIAKLAVFKHDHCKTVTVYGGGFRPATPEDKLLYNSKYIESATTALKGRAVQVSLTKHNVLVISADDGGAMYVIAPMRLKKDGL